MADEVIVTPTNNGPYQIRGRIRLVLPSGRTLETEEDTWLCRCGASQHKPFCDGTHKKIGFNAGEVAVNDTRNV
jgi:CDGSH iron-sulfur domain-containing protein 3